MSHSHTLTHSLSLSLTHTLTHTGFRVWGLTGRPRSCHIHTHTLMSHTLTHTHTLSLSISLFHTHTHTHTHGVPGLGADWWSSVKATVDAALLTLCWRLLTEWRALLTSVYDTADSVLGTADGVWGYKLGADWSSNCGGEWCSFILERYSDRERGKEGGI